VERRTASAAELLAPWPAPGNEDGPVVRAGRVSGVGAVVLGSTQDLAVIDADRAAAAGVDIVHRSTGGGAVLVAPDAQVWLDLWVPRRHHLWDDDIVHAATWLGEVWRQALESLGAGPLDVHRGAATVDVWSRLICFAGVGPGEVWMAGGDARPKVMGLAQRRTRAGARFHTSAPLRWDPTPLVALFDTDAVAAAAGRSDVVALADAAIGLRRLVPTWRDEVNDVDIITTVENTVIAALR
jgi:lipoate-protein ligase A